MIHNENAKRKELRTSWQDMDIKATYKLKKDNSKTRTGGARIGGSKDNMGGWSSKGCVELRVMEKERRRYAICDMRYAIMT
jgi:hypothetical protein